MSVSVVSKLMERSYRYCYEFFTRLVSRLSIPVGSVVVEVYVTSGFKGRRGRYEGDKVPVLVIVSRDGYEEYIPMISMEGGKVEEVITSKISRGSTIMTDEFKCYGVLENLGYILRKNMQGGDVYINNYENRASLLRPWSSKHTEN